MSKDIQHKTLMIDSNQSENASYHFVIENDSSYLVKIEGKKDIEITVNVEVRNDSKFTCLVINENEATVKIGRAHV